MKKHINIPIFIPHMGCPNQCVFCNQKIISGVEKFEAEKIREIIERSLSTAGECQSVEIAFFGGSFTGIDRSLMIELLSIAKHYIDIGRVNSIRCSTRPDYITDEILDILYDYGVKTVELGLQSASGKILEICKRGHTFSDEIEACKKIVGHGFTLGGQMMIGLPGATTEDEIATAEFVVKSGAKEARIYPTVVFKDTELCEMTKSQTYVPLSLEEAVDRSYRALKVLIMGGVKVLRIGLCESENLHSEETFFAGPNHSALGELVENRFYRQAISDKLTELEVSEGSEVTVYVPKGHISKASGHKKANKIYLMNEFNLKCLEFRECCELDKYVISIDVQERK